MKTKIILFLIIVSLLTVSCSHIDKETKSLVVYKTDQFKIGLGEKNKGVIAKVTFKF